MREEANAEAEAAFVEMIGSFAFRAAPLARRLQCELSVCEGAAWYERRVV